MAMQSVVCLGRLLSRALVNGVYNFSNCADPNLSRKCEPKLVTAVSGFPKDFAGRLRKGQFGDDAWLVSKYKTADVIGVADGVGGWRHYGVDPGEFSLSLMRVCERVVASGDFCPARPAGLIARSYHELLESKQQILGSSTACVMVLSREDSHLYTANIGDSGFVVVRQGEVVHRSEEQQHYFNTPFQLSLPPPGQSGLVLSDSPDSADTSHFHVEDGDVVMLATDGVFDNVPGHVLVSELDKLRGERDPTSIQNSANSIAWMARNLAFDANYLSPFAVHARENGIDAIGGKPDDITVLVATVAM